MGPWVVIFLLLLGAPGAAEDSLISKVQSHVQSTVTIRALTMSTKAPLSTRLDPLTGQVVLNGPTSPDYRATHGAGIILDQEGLIVTNFHTIKNATKITVKILHGRTVPAKIVKIAPAEDLALLQIDPPQALNPIQFGDSDQVKLKDGIVNIGSSPLLDHTLSGGSVSGLGKSKSKDAPNTNEIIEVKLELYEGDSGGPVLNAKGELIGMIVAHDTTKPGRTFAIPANKIKKLYLNN